MALTPDFHELYNPMLRALYNLDGSGTNQEILSEVVKIMNLTDEQSEVAEFRLGWIRSYLKRYGLIENPRRGFWALTDEGKNTTEVDPVVVVRVAQRMIDEEKGRR